MRMPRRSAYLLILVDIGLFIIVNIIESYIEEYEKEQLIALKLYNKIRRPKGLSIEDTKVVIINNPNGRVEMDNDIRLKGNRGKSISTIRISLFKRDLPLDLQKMSETDILRAQIARFKKAMDDYIPNREALNIVYHKENIVLKEALLKSLKNEYPNVSYNVIQFPKNETLLVQIK